MQILPVKYNIQNSDTYGVKNPVFGHGSDHKENHYMTKEKAIVATTTALGVVGSIALLAAFAKKPNGGKYSFNPKKMFTNIKDSYLAQVKFHDKEVISIGAGSCLGGLAGGYIIDKNKENRKAKRREALMQIGNVSIPILTVEGAAKLSKNMGKVAKTCFAGCGLIIGVYMANFLMNILSNALFKNTNGRDVKATDFSAHLDDMVVAANYISDAKIVHYIARLIPLALMFAGNEVGNKTAQN